ncbi:MAG: branched-chain amino acid ABC transporter permease [Chloroflexota bacterium]|nr:branched-chain amino acid ABC transporter permease [Chloroflexota bacterium]
MAPRLLRLFAIGVAALLIGWLVMLGLVWLGTENKDPSAILSVGTSQYFTALTIGAIYALIALGYTMVYGIIELINFAHGDVFMVGAFVPYLIFTNVFGFNGPVTSIPWLVAALLITLVVTMVILGLIGVTIERFAYRPLRNAPRLAPLITAIGVSFIIQNVVQVLISNSPVPSPQLFSLSNRFELFGASVAWLNPLIVFVALGLMIGLQLFVGATRLGRAMRSTAQDREAAQLMGVDINLTIAVTFFIGSALAGAAGLVYGLYKGSIVFNLGFDTGLKAFTAAVLGGIGNTTGAALGGFLIGFVEVASVVTGLARWQTAIVFGVLIVVLVFRPSGLLGQPLGERA